MRLFELLENFLDSLISVASQSPDFGNLFVGEVVLQETLESIFCD
jgi:hypothetical protein